MPHIETPNNAPRTSQDDTLSSAIDKSEILQLDKLNQLNGRLTTENRWLRNIIKALEVANMEAGAEKKLLINRIGIFEKIDAKLNLNCFEVQEQNIKIWSAAINEIFRNRMAFDATGAEVDREKYESATRSWRSSYTKQDNIEIILCQKVVAERMSKLLDAFKAEGVRLKSEVNRLQSEVLMHEKKLKVQSDVVTGLQEREKVSVAETKSKHEKDLQEKSNIIADLKEKGNVSAAEIKSRYETKVKEQDAIIANLKQKEKSLAAEIKGRYEKKLKEKDDIIANIEKREKSAVAEIKDEYEKKLKEQSNLIANLEEEKLTSTAEMKGLRQELAAHSEVSISILNRKRELMKPFEVRDDHVIETGNLSAHGGTCLADLFRIKSNADFDDSPWFKEHYGVTIDTVERFGGSAAFAKLVNMRYDMYNCKTEHRTITSEFEIGFQNLLIRILDRNEDAALESIDGYLLRNTKGKETFQKLCSIWDTTRASYRKRFYENRDLKKKSIWGGSVRSGASGWTGETQRRSKLDKIEEYGKDILASAKDAMPWAKH
ncbi:hypothetical protein NHQ30_005735 [Ciborinia camelliae]|nr:hypothetical protein NHQ30_005735 [Ciborinia camelliae]